MRGREARGAEGRRALRCGGPRSPQAREAAGGSGSHSPEQDVEGALGPPTPRRVRATWAG